MQVRRAIFGRRADEYMQSSWRRGDALLHYINLRFITGSYKEAFSSSLRNIVTLHFVESLLSSLPIYDNLEKHSSDNAHFKTPFDCRCHHRGSRGTGMFPFV